MVRARPLGDTIIEIPVLHERRAEKASTVRPVRDSLDHRAKLWRFRKVAAQLRRHAGRIAAGG